MELHMSKERHTVSEKNQSLPREAEAAKAMIKSMPEAQKAAEKKNSEPWYFTHC